MYIDKRIAYIIEDLLPDVNSDINCDNFEAAENNINKTIKQLNIAKFEIKKLQALINKAKLKRSE